MVQESEYKGFRMMQEVGSPEKDSKVNNILPMVCLPHLYLFSKVSLQLNPHCIFAKNLKGPSFIPNVAKVEDAADSRRQG